MDTMHGAMQLISYQPLTDHYPIITSTIDTYDGQSNNFILIKQGYGDTFMFDRLSIHVDDYDDDIELRVSIGGTVVWRIPIGIFSRKIHKIDNRMFIQINPLFIKNTRDDNLINDEIPLLNLQFHSVEFMIRSRKTFDYHMMVRYTNYNQTDRRTILSRSSEVHQYSIYQYEKHDIVSNETEIANSNLCVDRLYITLSSRIIGLEILVDGHRYLQFDRYAIVFNELQTGEINRWTAEHQKLLNDHFCKNIADIIAQYAKKIDYHYTINLPGVNIRCHDMMIRLVTNDMVYSGQIISRNKNILVVQNGLGGARFTL